MGTVEHHYFKSAATLYIVVCFVDSLIIGKAISEGIIYNVYIPSDLRTTDGPVANASIISS